jgi:folate-binding protein YgfZ
MAGLPEVYAVTAGRFVPQMLNLDLLGGISFTKGCYVGQEVVARAHHLGRIKRRMRLFTAPGGAAQPGDPVYRDARAAGHVVRVAPLDSQRDLLLAAVASGTGPLCLAEDGTALDERPLPYAIPEPGAPG